MDTRHHIHYAKHHPGFGYAISQEARLYSIFLAPLFFLLVIFGALWLLGRAPMLSVHTLPPGLVAHALALSLVRLCVAYALALVVALPLALLVVYNDTMGRLLLPFFDVLQSIPVLAFFPLLVALFVRSGYLEGAAICILFLGMVWNLVFSVVGGLKVVPTEIKSAARVFGVTGVRYLFSVLIPAIVPYLVTGSLLAWAQGWNILIIAEVLHTYLPVGSGVQDLLGIGNLLVSTSAAGQQSAFMYLLAVLTLVIALMNFFIWQKLLRYSEKFRFD